MEIKPPGSRITLDDLKRVLTPPPSLASKPSPSDWRRLGFDLPHDYKLFIETYGAGSVSSVLNVFSPFALCEGCNMLAELKKVTQLGEEMGADFSDLAVDTCYFPHKGGLLPFALTENHQYIFWITTGPADRWRLCCGEDTDFLDLMEHIPMKTVEFFYHLVANRDMLPFGYELDVPCPYDPVL
ncbi:hypothetical protein DB346_18440 [Verrucomicrobia bacterium LW23]|nr:hypothetical protein DB346_18440 [Verrucomicrobia bacterium LW23]